MFICQSRANLNVKIVLGKITHYLNPEISKMLVKGMFDTENSSSHSGP